MSSLFWAYLPIEFRSREFDGKVALALALIERGICVVFGQQWAIYDNLPRLPRGVVLFKSQNLIHHPAMKLAREVGHRVVSLEEESLALTSPDPIFRNCPRSTYAMVDLILTTGELEYSAHLSAGCSRDKLAIVGNPRIDLLKPLFSNLYSTEVSAIRRSLGTFVLVNTNFGLLNSKWGSIDAAKEIEIRAGGLDPNDPNSLAVFEQAANTEIEHQNCVFEFIDKMNLEFPERLVVVRPHPSENLASAKAQYEKFTNVKVIREGPHVPWTLAADCLIHTSCTTGLEAAIAGKFALSLIPKESWISQSMLSNRANPTYQNVDALINDVKRISSNQPALTMPDLSPLKRFIFNIKDELAIHRVSDEIAKACIRDGDMSIRPLRFTPRPPVLRDKFDVRIEESRKVIEGLLTSSVYNSKVTPLVTQLGDSLFFMPGRGVKILGSMSDQVSLS